MFDALEMSLQFLERLAPFETRIRQRRASLARQLADASESIALNLGEGRCPASRAARARVRVEISLVIANGRSIFACRSGASRWSGAGWSRAG